jgi:hypothetical protein
MERRKFIAGLGSIAAGGAAAIGTGAFTNVSATRDVSVSVAKDSNALLKLSKNGNANGSYADGSGDTISVDIGSGTKGVNKNATTKIYDIFTIENQGAKDALVYADPFKLDKQDAFDESVDGIYFDPQFSDMPNNGISSLGTLPDGTKFGSLSGVGGSVVSNAGSFEEALKNSNDSDISPDPKSMILPNGESFDFGVYIRTNDSASIADTTYDVKLKASSQLATYVKNNY